MRGGGGGWVGGVVFASRRRHTRFTSDWSSDVCSSDLTLLSQETVRRAVPKIAAVGSECECATALETAIVTAPDAVDRALVDRYQLLVGKYLGQSE